MERNLCKMCEVLMNVIHLFCVCQEFEQTYVFVSFDIIPISPMNAGSVLKCHILSISISRSLYLFNISNVWERIY